jgi:hypothetical protein
MTQSEMRIQLVFQASKDAAGQDSAAEGRLACAAAGSVNAGRQEGRKLGLKAFDKV